MTGPPSIGRQLQPAACTVWQTITAYDGPVSSCSMLAERPDLVRGLDVLEMGSGTGLCGIVAAKLGAAKV